MSRSITLPPSIHGKNTPEGLNARQITIIGGNGAGKSHFMEEMIEMCGDRSYTLNALSAFYADAAESVLPSSIDAQYRDAARQHSYMRTDAVSRLDKLIYMVFADELESLLDNKALIAEGKNADITATRLDMVRARWEKIFPGNRICRSKGNLMFNTTSGDDRIGAHALSQGEKTVLFYLLGVLYAPENAVIFIDSPSLFVHPSIISNLWNTIEDMRRDCAFVYNSVDVDFLSNRTGNTCIWVKRYFSDSREWDYEILQDSESLSDEIMIELAGSRKPVLFIEGDISHSIDSKLYRLVFTDRTVRPLGSCEKVIETTRSFNDLQSMHHLQSMGIVDRDRRTDTEVEYLRRKNILVPDVAEIENIFLLPDIIKVMAGVRGRDGNKILHRIEKYVMHLFKQQAEEQAMQHVRHKMKRNVECKIDGRFHCITALETHLRKLETQLQPRKHYNRIREEFAAKIRDNDYAGVLKVFNHKPMLAGSGLHKLLGYSTREEYVGGVLDVLKTSGKESRQLRNVIKHCLHANDSGQIVGTKPGEGNSEKKETTANKKKKQNRK
ncbi:MAG: DUF4435 domain-containing protein [Candidatus Amulumruptor caecigallinarius]|nr:DUF4435 domain-containing protein [Candidatus Amulumruptor caecigallinarius]